MIRNLEVPIPSIVWKMYASVFEFYMIEAHLPWAGDRIYYFVTNYSQEVCEWLKEMGFLKLNSEEDFPTFEYGGGTDDVVRVETTESVEKIIKTLFK